jgi:hypothetical protein
MNVGGGLIWNRQKKAKMAMKAANVAGMGLSRITLATE